MKVKWHSHSIVEIENNSGKRLIIDPFFTGNPKAILSAKDIKVDYVLITHGHNDHIGDAQAICEANDALLIANVEIADFFEMRGLNVHGLQPGGGYDFKDFYITMTPAIHGSSYRQEDQIIPLGLAGGFIVEADDQVVYHAGDTALFSDMKLIGSNWSIDIAFLPIGDNYTMGIKPASFAAMFLQAKLVVPIHYNTFEVIEQDPNKYLEMIKPMVGKVFEIGEELVL